MEEEGNKCSVCKKIDETCLCVEMSKKDEDGFSFKIKRILCDNCLSITELNQERFK